MKAWDVYHNGKFLDRVYFTENCSLEYVRYSLIRDDNYPDTIEVREPNFTMRHIKMPNKGAEL